MTTSVNKPSVPVSTTNRSLRFSGTKWTGPDTPTRPYTTCTDPLPQRVVLGQPPGQQDVREPDGHVGHHQPEEDPQRTPPGPRVAHRVELTPEVQQGAHQQRRDGRGDDPVLPERDHVHHDADREQQRHRLPGAPLPPLQAVREHQQQQADDDGDGVRDVDQRARHELVDPGQVGGVDQAGPDDLDDVGQADQEAQPACRDRHPAPLVPAVGRPRGDGRRGLRAGRASGSGAARRRRCPQRTGRQCSKSCPRPQAVRQCQTSVSRPESQATSVVMRHTNGGQSAQGERYPLARRPNSKLIASIRVL